MKWLRLAAEHGSIDAQRALDASGYMATSNDSPRAASPNPAETQDKNRVNELALQVGENAFFGSLLATVAAAVPAFLLFGWIRVKGAASSARQMGRKWLAWLVAAVTLTLGTKFVAHNFDINYFAQWVLGVVVFGAIAYGLGRAYWKLFQESTLRKFANAVIASGKDKRDNRFYEAAWNEIESGNMLKGLWARSFAAAAGNQDQARALYLKERAKELRTSSTESAAKPQ